jgi:adenine-specific DNA-methyltransferase
MATTNTKQQLKDLLRELFQLNNTDLDFGIYRILNIKAKEVEEFIEKDIDAKIESVKDKIINRQSADIKAELEEAKAKLEKDFKVDFQKEGDLEAKVGQFGQLELFMEPFNRFKIAKERLDNLRVSEDTEKSIYNELFRFFERYYEGGDFISKPRAGKNNYMIPYEGEEVKLYWANYDQYYIKTGENFKNYLFNNQSADPKTFTQIEFRILDAETSINNNKEEKGRLFVPAEEPFEWIADERKLLVKFYYRVPTAEDKKIWGDKQSVKTDNKGINQKLAALVIEESKKINDTELLLFLNKTRTNSKGEAIPLFLYHLERYTTVNKFDYFIHKDLKGFLTRELDTFIKNEVFSLAFLNPDWPQKEVEEAIRINTLKATAIRDIALVVIDFMSELEEFQKRLFEKKKFVVESHYCMTLDRIPASVYDEVIQYILTDKDKKQIQDWIDLKFITGHELEPKKTKGKKDDEFADAKAFLKANDKLVLDTKCLPEELKWKLLSEVNNLDEATTGLAINSENYQALKCLEKKYQNKIRCIYIDPPYNTGRDVNFTYKDAYPSSSWLAFMKDRLQLSKKVLSDNGIIFISIGDEEVSNLNILCDNIYGVDKLAGIIHRRKNRKPHNAGNTMSLSYEFILTYYKKNKFKLAQDFAEMKSDDKGNYALYPVFKADKKERIYTFKNGLIVEGNGLKKGIIKAGRNSNLDIEVLDDVIIEEGKLKEPIRIKGRFCLTDENGKLTEAMDNDCIFFNSNGFPKEKRYRDDDDYKIDNHHWDIEGGKNEDGDEEIKSVFKITGENNLFKYPKPTALIKKVIETTNEQSGYILDFFGGSGTTGHAVLSSNNENELDNKFILIEMGAYFDTVLLPRLKIVANCDPVNKQSSSVLINYIKLEQYEDTLNNIEIHTTAPQLSFLDNIRYQLNYGTKGSDSLINLEKFTKPFDYTMKIVQQNEPKDTVIDLVTTFNFLLGIEVQRYVLAKNNGLDYKVVIGKKGLQQYIIIWRNFDENSIDLKAEREFITKQDWYNTTAFVFCNGDNAFSAHPIEPEFIRLMNEPVL